MGVAGGGGVGREGGWAGRGLARLSLLSPATRLCPPSPRSPHFPPVVTCPAQPIPALTRYHYPLSPHTRPRAHPRTAWKAFTRAKPDYTTSTATVCYTVDGQ